MSEIEVVVLDKSRSATSLVGRLLGARERTISVTATGLLIREGDNVREFVHEGTSLVALQDRPMDKSEALFWRDHGLATRYLVRYGNREVERLPKWLRLTHATWEPFLADIESAYQTARQR